jgi:uncharacterized protein YtpQ (UPF0354 family)
MSVAVARALPVLSPVSSVEDTAPHHAWSLADAPVVRSFSSTLVVTYMLDESGVFAYVRERDVEPSKRDALHVRALDNLRAHAARRKLRFEPRAATYLAKLDGQHDASLLLLDELWDPPTRVADLDGEIVVAVPARTTLLFAGSNVEGGVDELRATLGQAGIDVLSPELFVRRKGRWEPYDRSVEQLTALSEGGRGMGPR